MSRSSDRRELFKELKAGKLELVYYLHGPDPYMLDAAVDAISDAAAPEGLNEFNHDKFRGRDTEGDRVLAAVEQLPFMSKRRIVILRDAQAMPTREFDVLAEYFENPSESTVLIVHAMTADKKLDGRNSAVKKMRKVAAEYEFKAFYENELDGFLNREASRRSLNLSNAARAYLVEAVGTELNPLIDALNRIDLYLGKSEEKRPVDDDLVQEIIAETRVHSIFSLTDALGSRDLERSLKLIDGMLLSGEPPLRILAMIARHFRILTRLKDPSLRSARRNDVARAVGVVPYFLKDYQRDAGRFGITELDEIRSRLLEVDSALKSSGLSDRVVLESLLMDICMKPAQMH